VLVLGLELQNLLVDSGGPWQESFVAEIVGNPDELLDGLLDSSGPGVEIADDIGGVPVAGLILGDAKILRNRWFQLSLPKKFLGGA
jgi:hypothetical protein